MCAAVMRVVVGFDGSPEAQQALRWATRTARAWHAPVDVVVAGGDAYPGSSRPQLGAGRLAHEWADGARQLLVDSDPEQYDVSVRDGRAADLLVGESGPTTLVVVGARGHGYVTGALIGSVSQYVTRYATGPVVVVREPENPATSRIVCGVDGSPESEVALDFAVEQADVLGVPVTAIYGWQVTNLHGTPLAGEVPVEGAREIWDAERWLGEAIAGRTEKYPDVAIECEAIAVPPVVALTDASTGAALVVVGTRGISTIGQLLLGSVSQGVLHHARCPVAVVR
jgi:nucleotide-binding universal stress UspA family protein